MSSPDKKLSAVRAKAAALIKCGFTPLGAARAAATYLAASEAVMEKVRKELEQPTAEVKA